MAKKSEKRVNNINILPFSVCIICILLRLKCLLPVYGVLFTPYLYIVKVFLCSAICVILSIVVCKVFIKIRYPSIIKTKTRIVLCLLGLLLFIYV